jgi:hypothetical protein
MAIAAEIAPGGRDAPENDGRDARRMEVADDRRRLVRGYVTVLEPQPPDAGEIKLAGFDLRVGPGIAPARARRD